jgi:putative spermidine/putrescine transport system permease protein
MDRASPRPASFYALATVFGLFVLFLYGPMLTIFVLSFQGPEGGLTFPMRGWSLHWFAKLWAWWTSPRRSGVRSGWGRW